MNPTAKMKCTLCHKEGHRSNNILFHPQEAMSFAKAAHAPRTKSLAGANEVEDISAIVEAIRTKSAAGRKIMDAFKAKFGLDLLDVKEREKSQNRKTHYDLLVLVGPAPGTWMRVEHKGSQKFTPIGPDQTPWAAGVQFHNGGCDMYVIGKIYARIWYNHYVASGILKEKYGLISHSIL